MPTTLSPLLVMALTMRSGLVVLAVASLLYTLQGGRQAAAGTRAGKTARQQAGT
jgi:hypothetical protein